MLAAPKIRFVYTPLEYRDMYEMLLATFIKKEWASDDASPKGKYNVWLKQDEKGFVVRQRFEVNPEYFYDRYSRAKQGKSISMDEHVAVAVLDYLDLKGRSFKELNASFRNSSRRPSREINAKSGAIAPPGPPSEAVERDPAVATVLRFYDAINRGPAHYKEAWLSLTLRLQNSICGGDFDRFCEGYNNTVAIKNVKVFNVVSTAEETVECTVYYLDEFRNYRSPTLSGWDEYTVAHLDEFVTKVKRLKAEVEAAGGQDFDRIELYKLFEPAASEYVWYKCRVKRDNLPLVFPTFRHMELKRLYRITCKQVEDEWLIDTIRLLNVYSSR